MQSPQGIIFRLEEEVATKGESWLTWDDIVTLEGDRNLGELPAVAAVCRNRGLTWERDMSTPRVLVTR